MRRWPWDARVLVCHRLCRSFLGKPVPSRNAKKHGKNHLFLSQVALARPISVSFTWPLSFKSRFSWNAQCITVQHLYIYIYHILSEAIQLLEIAAQILRCVQLQQLYQLYHVFWVLHSYLPSSPSIVVYPSVLCPEEIAGFKSRKMIFFPCRCSKAKTVPAT